MEALLWGEEGRVAAAHLPLPPVPQHSLYRSDPGRDRGRQVTTTQGEVARALAWWEEQGLETLQQGEVAREQGLSWASLPPLVNPDTALPQARQARKQGQLESLALALVQVARPGDILVDFCSGGGHLGLLLAHLLPDTTVHMVENKEESLARARERGLAMEGANSWFFQSNLDYYRGRFSVGASLHACGLATDLVIAQCTARAAAFVCCPCCYGGVVAVEGLTYPRCTDPSHLNPSLARSSQFASLPYTSYLTLGHAADQTEVGSRVEELTSPLGRWGAWWRSRACCAWTWWTRTAPSPPGSSATPSPSPSSPRPPAPPRTTSWSGCRRTDGHSFAFR